MRWRIVCAGLFAVALVSIPLFVPLQERLVWNRTDSAPTGLYWISQRPVRTGDWVLVSADSRAAIWAQSNGYSGPDWPLIKQVAAMEGDRVCRRDKAVFINNRQAGTAFERDRLGRELPVWRGCVRLPGGQVFLLSPHPRSLDGRYLGSLPLDDLDGVAILILNGGP